MNWIELNCWLWGFIVLLFFLTYLFLPNPIWRTTVKSCLAQFFHHSHSNTHKEKYYFEIFLSGVWWDPLFIKDQAAQSTGELKPRLWSRGDLGEDPEDHGIGLRTPRPLSWGSSASSWRSSANTGPGSRTSRWPGHGNRWREQGSRKWWW